MIKTQKILLSVSIFLAIAGLTIGVIAITKTHHLDLENLKLENLESSSVTTKAIYGNSIVVHNDVNMKGTDIIDIDSLKATSVTVGSLEPLKYISTDNNGKFVSTELDISKIPELKQNTNVFNKVVVSTSEADILQTSETDLGRLVLLPAGKIQPDRLLVTTSEETKQGEEVSKVLTVPTALQNTGKVLIAGSTTNTVTESTLDSGDIVTVSAPLLSGRLVQTSSSSGIKKTITSSTVEESKVAIVPTNLINTDKLLTGNARDVTETSIQISQVADLPVTMNGGKLLKGDNTSVTESSIRISEVGTVPVSLSAVNLLKGSGTEISPSSLEVSEIVSVSSSLSDSTLLKSSSTTTVSPSSIQVSQVATVPSALTSAKLLTGSGTGVTESTLEESKVVTSFGLEGGSTGLNFSGGPVTSSGTITVSGTLTQSNGGTGLDMTTGTNGQTLICSAGNTAALAEIEAEGVSIVNSTGSITLKNLVVVYHLVSGTTSWTVPAISGYGKVFADITLGGAGGGGGGGNIGFGGTGFGTDSAYVGPGGGGGGSGNVSSVKRYALFQGQNLSVGIGTGGAAGSGATGEAGASAGGNGGSSFLRYTYTSLSAGSVTLNILDATGGFGGGKGSTTGGGNGGAGGAGGLYGGGGGGGGVTFDGPTVDEYGTGGSGGAGSVRNGMSGSDAKDTGYGGDGGYGRANGGGSSSLNAGGGGGGGGVGGGTGGNGSLTNGQKGSDGSRGGGGGGGSGGQGPNAQLYNGQNGGKGSDGFCTIVLHYVKD